MRIIIEKVANGYIIRDEGAEETWVVANPDGFEAVAEMLVEVNARIGRPVDPEAERTMAIRIEPGARWLAYNPAGCSHEHTIERAPGEPGAWRCPCGQSFLPAPR